MMPPRQYKYLSGYSCTDLTDYTHVTHDISLHKCVQKCTTIGDTCVMMNHFTYFTSTDDARCYIFDKLCHISPDTLHINRSAIVYEDHTDNCTNHPLNWTDNVGVS
eukprot:407111_1